jgi:nucleoside-diphosphate-sugar epimerase
MKIFLAGAGGVIGRRLVPLLRDAGHSVVGTTRSPDRAEALRILGATPAIVDAFDAAAVRQAVTAAAPDAIIHQLTDLPSMPGTPGFADSLVRNSRLRVEGTRNLVDAAKAAGVARFVAQSIAFVYAKSETGGDRVETDALDEDPARKDTMDGVIALERATLELPEGIVLRYGALHGPGTWFGDDRRPGPTVHVDAAAQAAVLALTKGRHGIYNIVEDGAGVSAQKAKRELGFDAGFRFLSASS